ncbi:CheR family methyltransferase [Sphingobacterium spiritivorum]|uniref:CheR methyltransferase, SAM binding domain protein n=1 Tax=Sphingobacterium spiritivorum ATCC 33861 TaxID=525373 RepID=D7VQS2_SPHSI|nr:protein-glutamate O-methyltransferase CheR [Sphingobacterium spiritivorum]EFK56123.1 CheR methyltransferase, SAM binding domain protein [Sphingobacterium spiritivorum ATCC 33861]QQT35760.1 protein-glutamate O-methyltransferase CheR [Sphingobacterium spiritivorum]WQD32480.1 protein-glutamate O-methyltransferase CheR [Sphingobacterium spiritivorum]SUJ09982.1 Chemotaxis protein methyltransferase [Sphingobacterium spiritivorum]
MLEPNIIKNDELEMLLADVSALYGYDFTQYSRASLKRRINRICLIDKFTSFAELRYKVLNHPEYLQRFIEEITVNVTEMFRDPSFYKALRENVFPQLGTYPFIRIWLAGCSTGEEVYSMAIMLKEANLYHRSLLYATDINPGVLEKARKGIFPISQMKQYSENYILSGGKSDFSTYYTANYDVVKFNEDLKEKMIFSTHNLVSDSSFNEFQLVICRNVLIYFDKELQNKVFRLFDDSLDSLGFLALGSKETLRFSALESRYKQLDAEKIWRKSK